ncbi:MAG: polysaccharide deacetylase family protein [Verrucomicrobia bacterium]|nr:polysaccharide deacetylase family protein [Verrucomicrobiota bacterium]
MQNAWHILNYHDVSWESSIFTRGIGGTVSPDMFRKQVETLKRMGSVISIQRGLDILKRGEPISEPLFSLWFDDGFAGVRRHALPICREHGITAGISVCSRFVDRREMFWRCVLSFLSFCDGLRVLRSRLRPLGYMPGESLKRWSLDHFSEDMIRIINDVYCSLTTDLFRLDAFRLFDDREGLKVLANEGWLIANHTQAHYPVGPSPGEVFTTREFQACAPLLEELGGHSRIWVAPFAGGNYKDPTNRMFYEQLTRRHQTLLIGVENMANTSKTFRNYGRVFRFAIHDASPNPLV